MVINELNVAVTLLNGRLKKMEDEGGIPREFLRKQAETEKELREMIEEQLAALDMQDVELKRLAEELSARPTEEEVEALVGNLTKKLKKLAGKGGGPEKSRTPDPSPTLYGSDLENMLENFKYEIRRKTTRDEVLRLVSAMLGEATESMRREVTALQDDPVWTLRTATMDDQKAGRMKFKVFRGSAASLYSRASPGGGVNGNASVGSAGSATIMQHSHPLQQAQDAAATVYEEATLPADAVSVGYVGASHTRPHVPQTYDHPNQLILASYPNGRGGALRPLQRQDPGLGGGGGGEDQDGNVSVGSELSLTSSAARRVERPGYRGGGGARKGRPGSRQ